MGMILDKRLFQNGFPSILVSYVDCTRWNCLIGGIPTCTAINFFSTNFSIIFIILVNLAW